MLELWAIAFPILLVDVANPVLLAAVIVCASTERPTMNALMLILGHTLMYLITGLLILYGLADLVGEMLQPVWEWFQNPEPADFVVGFLLGVLLLGVALHWKISPPKPTETTPEPAKRGPIGYFAFGAVINVVGSPFAIPYLAFINQLTRQDGSLILPNLILYNILYALPFLIVPLAVAFFGNSVMPLLQKINQSVDKFSAYILPLMFAGLGLLLVLDALLYFTTGSGLI